MDIKLFNWNIYHGRDGPPDKALYTKWAEWTRKTERNDTHVQVNRDLWREYTDMICAAGWDVAMLQECPPRWHPGFERECGCEVHETRTSRNMLEKLSWAIARGWPDLIGSSEGGSNMTLARGSAGRIVERGMLKIRRFRPERRTMNFVALECGLCIANLHASTAVPLAEDELLRGAEKAVEWSRGRPLVFGGDTNVRPYQSKVFDQLAERHGLTGITATDAIDHLLTRNLEVVEAARQWPPERRELRDPDTGLTLRLSDHAPIELTVRID
jgi:hypothetical protein